MSTDPYWWRRKFTPEAIAIYANHHGVFLTAREAKAIAAIIERISPCQRLR